LGVLPPWHATHRSHAPSLCFKELTVAIEKKKREGKKTIPASQAKRTRSGAKRRQSDGKQAPQTP
jgi:hypothetical protein